MYTENNYIMWLSSVPNINTETKYNLIDYFGSAEEIYTADAADIAYSKLISQAELNSFKRARADYDFDREIEKLEKSPIKYYTYNDKEFPKQLNNMKNPPLGLYVWGEIPDSPYPYVSIVGTRRASEYGATVCHRIAYELAENGITIVSGMAFGIDSIAHKGCIEAGGKTIAVLGCGADVCYPASNRSLRDSIIENGCVISEFPMGTGSQKYNFPYRNRIVACLSSVVVVVEGEDKSGTLITANHALDNGREVMAIPGNITSSLSQAPNRLIADGCSPVLYTQDILDAMNIKITEKEIKNISSMPDISAEEKIIYDIVGYEPLTIDEICAKSSMSISLVGSILMMLELKGCIMKLSGQKYAKTL